MSATLKTITILSVGLMFAFSDICVAEGAMTESEGPMTASYSKRELLKNWALSACLAKITDDAKTKADANATASVYLGFFKQPIEDHGRLQKLVQEYVDRKYSSSIPSEFNTMKCIDLFRSGELDSHTAWLARWIEER
jgi:hypothetical protein